MCLFYVFITLRVNHNYYFCVSSEYAKLQYVKRRVSIMISFHKNHWNIFFWCNKKHFFGIFDEETNPYAFNGLVINIITSNARQNSY